MGRDRHCRVRIYQRCSGVAISAGGWAGTDTVECRYISGAAKGMGRDKHCRVRIYQRCS